MYLSSCCLRVWAEALQGEKNTIGFLVKCQPKMKCKALDAGLASGVVKGVLLALVTIHPPLAHTRGLERALCAVHCPHHTGCRFSSPYA